MNSLCRKWHSILAHLRAEQSPLLWSKRHLAWSTLLHIAPIHLVPWVLSKFGFSLFLFLCLPCLQQMQAISSTWLLFRLNRSYCPSNSYIHFSLHISLSVCYLSHLCTLLKSLDESIHIWHTQLWDPRHTVLDRGSRPSGGRWDLNVKCPAKIFNCKL